MIIRFLMTHRFKRPKRKLIEKYFVFGLCVADTLGVSSMFVSTRSSEHLNTLKLFFHKTNYIYTTILLLLYYV